MTFDSNNDDAVKGNIRTSVHKMLEAIWRSPAGIYQIGTLNQKTKQFKNIPVTSVSEAVERGFALSDAGLDVYIALAEFKTSDSRKAANVKGSYGLGVDVDCGDAKVAAGKGYKNTDEAMAALQKFCDHAKLPLPTYIASSGAGLHLYWVMDRFVSIEDWQACAAKLKNLTHSLEFLADDTRTADIAGVLRMPGTLNYKYDSPRPVTIKHTDDKIIEWSAFSDAIDSAHLRLCNVAAPAQPDTASLPNLPLASKSEDIAKLPALLERIDPNVGYDDWLKVLMAIYHTTGGSEQGFALADKWSSGGDTYKGTKEIRVKWNSFDSYTGKRITIATLIKMAMDNDFDSLTNHNEFTPCDTEVIVQTEQSIQQVVEPLNPLTKYSLRDRSSDVERQSVAQVPVMGKIALMGQSSIFYAAPNTGKTAITLYLLIEGIKDGSIDPSQLYYLNMDDSSAGLLIKLRMAEEYRFHMLAEGHRDFRVTNFVNIIEEMIEKNQARGVIIVLDTLKKFVDLMDKSKGSNFGKVMRRFIATGGTLIALAHTNKNPGRDGKPKFGGTSDIVDDCDCAYTIALVSDEDGKRVVEFDNIKRRGDVAQTAGYSYSSGNGVSYNELLASIKRQLPWPV